MLIHSARKPHQFMRENVRIHIRAKSIRVLGVKLWNSLNASLVSVMSKYIFKCHYVNIFMSKYIMYIYIDIMASKSVLGTRVYLFIV